MEMNEQNVGTTAANPIQVGTTSGVAAAPNGAPSATPNSTPNDDNIQWGTPVGASTTVTAPSDDSNTEWGTAATNLPGSKEITINHNDPIWKKVGEGVGSVFEGVGEGVGGTVAGGWDLVNKLAQKTGMTDDESRQRAAKISAYLHQIAGDNVAQHGVGQDVGKAGETIGEFLTGDAALKGLSFADRMMQVSKISKILESSPKLLAALRLGVNLSKATADLSPEEIEAVKASPILARLVAAGFDSTRNAAVQGVQTEVKTGGDTKQAGEDSLGAGLVTAALGGTLGAVSGAAVKAGKTAEVVNQLTQAAEKAPTEQGLTGNVEKLVAQHLAPEQAAAQSAIHAGTEDVKGFAQEAASKDASKSGSLAEMAKDMAKTKQAEINNAYKTGIGSLKNELGNEELDYKGSPLEAAAKQLAGAENAQSKPLDQAFTTTRPGTPKANRMIDLLAGHADPTVSYIEPKPTGILDAQGNEIMSEPKTEVEEKPPTKLNFDELLERRKQLGELLRNTGWDTADERADRDIYKTLMKGVDNSMDTLAQQAATAQEKLGPSDLLKRYQAINEEYRQSQRLLDNKDVQSILQGNVGDVAAKLMRGDTVTKDIDAVHQFLGDDNFNRLGVDTLQRMSADAISPEGVVDYNKLLKTWNKMKPEVREAMFGKFNSDTFSNVLNGISGADAKMLETNNTLANIMGNGDVKSVLKDHEKLNELQKVIGPQGMSELGKSVLQHQIREASSYVSKDGTVKFHFDPDKFISWVSSMKDNPEVMNTLFKATPESEANFQKLLRNVSQASSQKILTKLGLAGAAGATALGAGMHAIIGILAASEAGGGGQAAAKVMDQIANKPAVWDTLAKIGEKASKASTNPTIQNIVKPVAAKSAYEGTKPALKTILGGK